MLIRSPDMFCENRQNLTKEIERKATHSKNNDTILRFGSFAKEDKDQSEIYS